jgi:hypothetical protein
MAIVTFVGLLCVWFITIDRRGVPAALGLVALLAVLAAHVHFSGTLDRLQRERAAARTNPAAGDRSADQVGGSHLASGSGDIPLAEPLDQRRR